MKHSAFKWIPTLYFAEALPYVAVMTISVVLYKRMGISNTDIALYTGWLYLPWVIKPLWSPFLELLNNNRWWIIITQFIIGVSLAGVAFAIPTTIFFQLTLAFFWLMAFTSATHDISADGFYIEALDSHDQSFYVGIRSTFYRLATLFGQGLLVVIAGIIETNTGLEPARLQVDVNPNLSTCTQTSLPKFTNINNDCDVIFSNHKIEMNSHLNICNTKENVIEDLERKVYMHNLNCHFIPNNNSKNDISHIEPNQLSSFERWIKNTFGEDRTLNHGANQTDEIGNIAVVGIRLKERPKDNTNIIMQLSFEQGDKSIFIDEGTFQPRFTFNLNNWNKNAYFIIKCDPHIKEKTSAYFIASTGSITIAWTSVFSILSFILLSLSIYHHFFLPKYNHLNEINTFKPKSKNEIFKEFGLTFKSFLSRPQIIWALLFMLLFRFPEAQLVKLAQPFMLDSIGQGGLGLSTGQVGFVYGTIGMIGITIGGILGGIAVANGGLKKWFWYMILSISLPDIVYVWLSYTQNNSMIAVNTCVFIEQFGYGFGFTAYMLYLIYFSRGDRSTSIYAISTAFMALGMMIPGMIAGWLEDLIGYKHFFVYVMISCIVTFLVSIKLKIDPDFGKKDTR